MSTLAEDRRTGAPAFARWSCQYCGAALQVEPGALTVACPYCGSAQVLERPGDEAEAPLFLLGFLVSREAASAAVQRYLRGHKLFAPSGVGRANFADVRGLYVPTYLYTATARADYHAEIGEDYLEEHAVGRGRNRHIEHRMRTEWRPLSGTWAAYTPDVLVCASKGLSDAEFASVGLFDHRRLARYVPAAVAGWIAEEPSRERDLCLQSARELARTQVGGRLTQFMPGDHHRGLRFGVSLDEESLDLTLVPVWVFALRYSEKRPPVRIVVNGQTGVTGGKVPVSWVKVLVAVLVALGLMMLAAAVFQAFGANG